jgi:hypothetical protein
MVSGCASQDVKLTNEYDKVVIIKPSGIHEDCFEILPDQKLECVFEGTKPLDFNIHYHEDKEIYYPVKKDNVSIDEDVFYPEIKQYYCLMWTNKKNRTITLTYEYNIVKR